MDIKFSLLQKILPLIELYVDKEGVDDPERFAIWLTGPAKDGIISEIAPDPDFDAVEFMANSDPQAALSFHLSRLNKYAKYYLKAAFEDSPLTSADDFGYLAALAYVPSLTKTELIRMNVGETSGGMDIIKRLVREGLAETFVDEEDRRARRVRITERGRGVFFSVLPELNRAGKIVKGQLSESALKNLVAVLASLDGFHQRIYSEEKSYDLKQIEDRYCK